MRANTDAVMVGAETVRRDDPSLLAKLDPPPARQPSRVVLTSSFDIPSTGRLFKSLDVAPLIVVGGRANAHFSRLMAAGAKTGIVVAEDGFPDCRLALNMLRDEWQISSVLVEGGGQLAASLIGAGLVDRLEWFRAPILLGAEGRPSVAALALARLSEAPAFRRVALAELGPDLWESYERA